MCKILAVKGEALWKALSLGWLLKGLLGGLSVFAADFPSLVCIFSKDP